MTLFENLLTAGILFALALIGYLKVTNKTLIDFVHEVREIFSPPPVIEGGLPKQ